MSMAKVFTDLFINNEWVSTDSKYAVVNPATEEKLADVSFAQEQHIQAAIASASVAFESWKKLSAKARSEYLAKWYELIITHKEQLAYLVTLEAGKPLKEALGEVLYAASFVQWAAEQAKRIDGMIIDSALPQTEIQVTYEPVGVVAAITPWNFPLAMVTRKIAPAIAAGCTIVLKPAELTPLSALYLAHLSQLANFPAGVINLIVGNPVQIGEYFTSDARIRKLTFTGSTKVGKLLLANSAATVKKVSLELGGNAPFIVFEDANLPDAVANLMLCKFRNAGQTCVCANRILVHKSVSAKFAALLKEEVAKLQVGNGVDAQTTIGPLINRAGKQKAQNHISNAITNGATLYYGGDDLGGNFLQPTILTNMPANSSISCEETFGPVAALFEFDSEEEAISLANNTQFGLAAYFFTSDYQRIQRVRKALQAGMIGVNTGVISVENAPFGGIKESGLGREGGQIGIYEFVEAKYTMNKYSY